MNAKWNGHDIPTDQIGIIQKHSFNRTTRLIDRITLEVQLPEDFPKKYKDAVIKSANLCAVKRHLVESPEVEVKTATS